MLVLHNICSDLGQQAVCSIACLRDCSGNNTVNYNSHASTSVTQFTLADSYFYSETFLVSTYHAVYRNIAAAVLLCQTSDVYIILNMPFCERVNIVFTNYAGKRMFNLLWDVFMYRRRNTDLANYVNSNLQVLFCQLVVHLMSFMKNIHVLISSYVSVKVWFSVVAERLNLPRF